MAGGLACGRSGGILCQRVFDLLDWRFCVFPMASQWYFQRLSVELGPVGFDELIRMVRVKELGADDLVREDWNSEWRPAALAIGLFHMAGRKDLLAKWEAEQEELRRQEEEARAAAERALEEEQEEASWERRLREVEAERLEQEAERAEELLASRMEIQIDEATAAALAEIEARERELEPGRWGRLWQRLTSSEALRRGYRWGVAIVVPNIVAATILQWSHETAQRLPDRKAIAAGLKAFPLWGLCDPPMYFFLLFDVMLFTGVAAYFVARILESLAED